MITVCTRNNEGQRKAGMCIMGSVFLRKTYLGRRGINKSLSHSFSILKNLVNVSSQTMCMLKMCNLIRYDRLCSKCDNSKGMSKHNISLLPWKMFAMEQSRGTKVLGYIAYATVREKAGMASWGRALDS